MGKIREILRKSVTFEIDYRDFARRLFKEVYDPSLERVMVVYGPPGTGKTTLQRTCGYGIDTDDVRRMFGLHVGFDDELIFLLTLFLTWSDKSLGPGDGTSVMYTNLLDEVLKYDSSCRVRLRYLDIPKDAVIAERLSKRDGMSIDEARKLVKSWDYGSIRQIVRENPNFSLFEPSRCTRFGYKNTRLRELKREFFGDLYLHVSPDADWLLDDDPLHAAVDEAVMGFINGGRTFVFEYEGMFEKIIKKIYDHVYEHSSVVRHVSECGDELLVAVEQVVYRRILLLLLRDFYYEVYHNSAVCSYFEHGIENYVYQQAKLNLPLHIMGIVEFADGDVRTPNVVYYSEVLPRLQRLERNEVLFDCDSTTSMCRKYFSSFLRLRDELLRYRGWDCSTADLATALQTAFFYPDTFHIRDMLSLQATLGSSLVQTHVNGEIVVTDEWGCRHVVESGWNQFWSIVTKHFEKLCREQHFLNKPKAGFYGFLAMWAMLDFYSSGRTWYGDHDG